MDIDNNVALQQSPSERPENGVAPHSGPVAEDKPDLSYQWLAHHRHGWQFGESGILEAIASELANDIPEEHRWVVEFGAGDSYDLPLTCDPVMRKLKWPTLLIEGKRENCDRLRLRVPFYARVVEGIVGVSPGQLIDEYMEQSGVPQTPGLMVVDVDSIDYYIVAGMKARPYILCVEHMDEYYPEHPRAAFVPQLTDCGKLLPGGTFHLSATAQAFDITVPQMGYKLIFRTRINSVYVRSDVAERLAKPPGDEIRLNIGAGGHNDPRYIALDIKTGTDARNLPYEDNSVDEVYASHILEHFSFYEQDAVLAEWTRVLKPGGIMRIAVPNAEWIAKSVLDLQGTGRYRDVEMVAYGAHNEPTNVHRAMFTETHLRERMNFAGIGFVTRFKPFITDDCANHECSLNLEGVKRWWPKIEKPKVTLVLSQPRLTFSGHETRLLELAQKLGFDTQPSGGAFWDRDMTCATKAAIGRFDSDFLLYSDYDSMFEPEDVLKLLDTINSDPTMAAIGCVQMSRHNDTPLVFENHIAYSEPVSRVKFQHFGLTIIRREVFDEMPQPWFWSVPGRDEKTGEWEWDVWARSDADITFWRNLFLAGFRVYQHNEVCIGHIVQAIKYPRKEGRGVMLVPMENYQKAGKPKDVGFNPECFRKKPTFVLETNK